MIDSDPQTTDTRAGLVSRDVDLQAPTVGVEQAAVLLGISRASAFRAVHRGQLPSIRIGRRIVIPTAPLRILLQLPSTPTTDVTGARRDVAPPV